jgi:vancomycin resistance protein YoaR
MSKSSKSRKAESPSVEAGAAGLPVEAKKPHKHGKKPHAKVVVAKQAKPTEKPAKKAAEKPALGQNEQPYPITLHIDAVKDVLHKSVSEFKNDIDPDKAAAFRKETVAVLKKIAVGSVAVIAVAAVLVIPETYYDGKVMARTSIAGVSIGSIDATKAKNSLLVETERFMKTPITFIYGEKKISMTPEELGVKPDLDRTVAAIPVNDFTRTNPALLAASLLTSRDLPLIFNLDYTSAASKIGEKLDLNGNRARNAHLVRAEEGFAVEPEKTGTAIDENLLASSIRTDIASMKSNPVIVTTAKETPRITAAALEKQKTRLEALVNNDVTLKNGDKELLFKTADHLDAIEYKEKTVLQVKDLGLTLPVALGENQAQTEPDSGAKLVSALEISINPTNAMPFLRENMLKDIEIPTSGVTVTRAEDGKINIEGKGEDGKSVPEDRLMAAMALAINQGIDTVPVPIVTEKAPVKISSDLQELGIRELLATGHTSFYGSHANRIHNINVGIAKYNGVLVKPGEEFSFNTILGEVDAKNGYLPEKVIKKNKVETEYGGGICQVSSTLYRAALFAGVPITERNPHSWLVSYYGQVLGAGLDATIYLGVSDVKFINDTPGYLLIQAYVDGANAYFKFYGTSDGRTTELDGPYGGGLHYKWYRIIKKGGDEIKETIVSNYKPMPASDPPPEKPKVAAQNPPPKSTL